MTQRESPSRSELSWQNLISFAQETVALKNYAEAEKSALRALEEAERFDGNDRRLGTTLELLSEIYYSTGRYELGAPVMVRLLKMYKTCLGPEHLDTATIIANLAVLYHAAGRFLEAEDSYEEAMRIKGARLGDNHPEVQSIAAQHAKLLHDIVDKASKKKHATPSGQYNRLRKSGQYRQADFSSNRLMPD